MADLPLMLAGPIVRRVEPTKAAIWVALSKSAVINLTVFRGAVDATAKPTDIAASGTGFTVRIGDNLHVGVVVADVTSTPFDPQSIYSYDVEMVPGDGGAASSNLLSLGLLQDTDLPNGYKQQALGYVKNFLPSFNLPPPSLTDLRIVQGSCRKSHDRGRDALRQVDNFIGKRGEPPLDQRPHMLFLTGDQIYADDVPLPLLPLLNTIGQQLLGTTPEKLAVGSKRLAANLDLFPAGLRQKLITDSAKMTSTAADCHLMSFGEFCAMYVMVFSNVLWPATFDPPTSVDAPTTASADRPAEVQALISTNPDVLVHDNCERRRRYCQHLSVVKDIQNTGNDFVGGLGEVRRALANVATYMIFDDHEVSDDWYLSLPWKRDVLTSPLGRNIIRNALLAYLFFQGWGNDPAAFAAGGDNASFFQQATLAAQAVTVTTSDGSDPPNLTAADTALGLTSPFDSQVRWHYRLLDPSWRFGVLVLDERTRRGYGRRPNLPSEIAPPALIAPVAMTQQIPNPLAQAGRDVLFVIAPAPVLGVPVIEELFQPLAARVSDFRFAKTPRGQFEVDQEPWSQDPGAFEQLLELLAPAQRIVLLSGDVHFAHGASLTYWPKTATTPSRFAQFTSSAFQNSGSNEQVDLLHSFGFGQRIFRSGAPKARLGWHKKDPSPLSFPTDAPLASYPLQVRMRFRDEPLLLPAQVWGAGVTFAIEPDWIWNMEITLDTRPETQRPPDDRPPLPADVPATPPIPLDKLPELASYHVEAMKQRGLSRQTVFPHNVGVISLSDVGGVITATHTIFSPPIAAQDTFAPITQHVVALDIDPTTPKPGLQSP